MSSVTVRAHAKVNLFLKVLSRRRDSYHNIQTVFERISLYDTIRISKARKGITIDSDEPITKNPKDNLMYKAALAMLKHGRIGSGVKIKIKKRIPIAAGLGGGSSDAAAVMLGVNRLFKLGLKREKLLKMGREIGADVPFFLLDASFASGKGIGGNLDIIESRRRLWHLLVFPGFKLDTKSIYEAFDRLDRGRLKRLTCKKSGVKIVSSLTGRGDTEAALHNDLEHAAVSKKAGLGIILKGLGQLLGKKFIVSGSGPSLFCLCGTGREAYLAKKEVLRHAAAGNMDGWRVFTVRTA